MTELSLHQQFPQIAKFEEAYNIISPLYKKIINDRYSSNKDFSVFIDSMLTPAYNIQQEDNHRITFSTGGYDVSMAIIFYSKNSSLYSTIQQHSIYKSYTYENGKFKSSNLYRRGLDNYPYANTEEEYFQYSTLHDLPYTFEILQMLDRIGADVISDFDYNKFGYNEQSSTRIHGIDVAITFDVNPKFLEFDNLKMYVSNMMEKHYENDL